jgi:hypothetical protein
MITAIEELITKGAVAKAEPVEGQFVSTLFLVEKQDGSGYYRPVINLRV